MLKPEDVEALRKLAADHDRGGFYLKYYELVKDVDPVAARHALREAEIATYSGPLGGALLQANLDAEWEANFIPGARYPDSLDDLSNEIVAATFTEIEKSYTKGGDSAGVLTRRQLLEIDHDAWDRHGIGALYPGNLIDLEDLFTGDFSAFEHWNWLGILNAIDAFGPSAGTLLGNRAEEFADPKRYLWLDDGHILRIIDRRDGHVAFVWDSPVAPWLDEAADLALRGSSDPHRDLVKEILGADRARLHPSLSPPPPIDMLNDVPPVPRDLRLREQQGALQPSGAPPAQVQTTALERLFDEHGTLPFDEAPSPLAGAFAGERDMPAALAPWLASGSDHAGVASFIDTDFAAPLAPVFEAPAPHFSWAGGGEVSPLDKWLAHAPARLAHADSVADMSDGRAPWLGELSHIPFPLSAAPEGAVIDDTVDHYGGAAPFAFDLEAASPFRRREPGRSAAAPWPMFGDPLAAEAEAGVGALSSDAGRPIDGEEGPPSALPSLLSAPSPAEVGSVTEGGTYDPLEALPRMVEAGFARIERRLAEICGKVTAVDIAPARLDSREVIRIVREWIRRETNKPRNSSWHYDLRRNYTPPGPIPL